MGHGSVVLDVAPERVRADFSLIRSAGDTGLLVGPRPDPQATVAHGTSVVTEQGSRRSSGPVAPLGARSDAPRGAHR